MQAPAPSPNPLSSTVWRAPDPPEATLNRPLRIPVAVGLKLTRMAQLVGTVAPEQVLPAKLKSAGLTPVKLTSPIVAGPPLVAVIATLLEALVMPTG